jgi:hypothetical protein
MPENSGDSAKVGREKALPNVNDCSPLATPSLHRQTANVPAIQLFSQGFCETCRIAGTHPAMMGHG